MANLTQQWSTVYDERIYAGVLGKIIGVYLGRPIESMLYRDILAQLGRVDYYVHAQRRRPLVISDDDLTGTFRFINALRENGCKPDITSKQIGRSWLNTIIRNKTILWWGGVGVSTEHTAFARLRAGIDAPESGSIARNGQLVAEQIGAQIFIDCWAMVNPADPDSAARMAREAARVSHDGVAVDAAVFLAAMEAAAFVERDLHKLFEIGLRYIPADSLIRRMLDDCRDAREKFGPDGWERAMTDVLEAKYGYDKYGGGCHVVPNHGIILVALLFGNSDFQRSLMIANTLGWDTDCNSGNVGCLLGIKDGIATIDAGPDWRGPVIDRVFLPTSEPGTLMSDAGEVAADMIGIARRLRGLDEARPKDGARYHFAYPGSLQGWHSDGWIDCADACRLQNVERNGTRAMAIKYEKLAPGRVARVRVATFTPAEGFDYGGYAIIGSPSVYAGQEVVADVSADAGDPAPVNVGLTVRHYDADRNLVIVRGPTQSIAPGAKATLRWTVPQTNNQPIGEIGIEVSGQSPAGTIYVDRVDVVSEATIDYADAPGIAWARQWIDAADMVHAMRGKDVFLRVIQNDESTGMAISGGRRWRDYSVTAQLSTGLAATFGVAVRVQGLRRYLALTFSQAGQASLVAMKDEPHTLVSVPFKWPTNARRTVRLRVRGDKLDATLDGEPLLSATIPPEFADLDTGGFAVLAQLGRVDVHALSIRPSASDA
jgi:ADP-ribosylglycohydrolase